jgi:hypothetical protein
MVDVQHLPLKYTNNNTFESYIELFLRCPSGMFQSRGCKQLKIWAVTYAHHSSMIDSSISI